MTQVRNEGRVALHKHPFWQMDWYKGLKKNAIVSCNGKRHSLDSSKAFVIPPFAEHGMEFSSPYFCCHIMFELPGDEFHSLGFTAFRMLDYGHIMDLIFPESAIEEQSAEMKIAASALELLLLLLRKEKGISFENKFFRGNPRIELAVDFFEKNLVEEFSLSDVAASAKMSLNHFIREFKREKGMTPMRFFRRMKIEKASGLLKYSDLNVSQIADSLGFSDLYTFSKVFKKEIGESPANFRKTHFK